ncbi:MAG: hypothetical protein RIF41_13950 [Polyangiaceae bacterium]
MATIWRGAKQGRLEPALLAFALGAAGLLAAPSAHAQQPQGGDDEVEAEPPDDADETEEVEPATVDDDAVLRYPPSSVRLPLILGGASLFGVAYGLTAMSSRLWPEVPGADHMLIPVAGPWVALAQSGCAENDTDGCTVPLVFRTILLVLDGLVQAGGVGLVGEGLFMTTEAAGPDGPDAGPDKAEWHVVPDVGPTHTGIGVVGTF